MQDQNRIANALFFIRLTIFIVIFMWTLDKFLDPAHAARVFQGFYFLPALDSTVMYIIGAVEMVILLGFLLGIKKTFTYGFILAIHTVSTITPYKQYLDPYTLPNLLFFASIPMLAACWALFSLRDMDTKFTFG